VKSDVTTLLLSGSFDPSTPRSWGDHVAETLTHAHQASIANATHGVVLSECGMVTLARFLHDPEHFADPACVAQSSSRIWSSAAAAQR
jgi:pimeloyl-ACP methyl ester carboxylesterase